MYIYKSRMERISGWCKKLGDFDDLAWTRDGPVANCEDQQRGSMIQNLNLLASLMASLAMIAGAICAGLWWIFRRGLKSGQVNAEIEEMQRVQNQIQAEINRIRERLGDAERELERMRARRKRAS